MCIAGPGSIRETRYDSQGGYTSEWNERILIQMKRKVRFAIWMECDANRHVSRYGLIPGMHQCDGIEGLLQTGRWVEMLRSWLGC